MRKSLVTTALAALAMLPGCFKVNADLSGFTGGGSPGGSGEPGGGTSPSQLPSSGGGSWRDIASQVAGRKFLGAEQGAVFYAFDTLAYPRQPVELAAKLLAARDLKPIPGATVAIYQGDYLAGRVETGADGIARLSWTPPQQGNYAFLAKIVAVPDEAYQPLLQIEPVSLLVAARPKETPFVVVDLDHTVVDSSFFRVLLGGARPMADSVEVLERISERYGILYLTHRPDLLTRRSKDWLIDNRYPRGPLLVSEMKDVFDSGEFKTAKLSEVRKAFPGVSIGIGDKLTDAQAYVNNGLTAYLIPDYDREDPDEMRDMARSVRKLRGGGRLHVVSGWREIEESLFRGRAYPPEAFARGLEAQATRIEAEDRRRDKDDDD